MLECWHSTDILLTQNDNNNNKCFFMQDDIDPSATPRTPRERIGLTGNLASISMPGDSGAEVTPRPIEFSDSGSEGEQLALNGAGMSWCSSAPDSAGTVKGSAVFRQPHAPAMHRSLLLPA